MFPEIDLREPAMSCADATTQAFDRLAVNDGFVFVADHDPIALRYLLEAERAGQFTWEPLAEDDTGSGGSRSAALRPRPAQARRVERPSRPAPRHRCRARCQRG